MTIHSKSVAIRAVMSAKLCHPCDRPRLCGHLNVVETMD